MISYELAKTLYDAGFPSSRTDGPPYDFGGGVGSYWHAPILSELIEACGFHFRDLSQHTPKPSSADQPRWIAKGGIQVFGTGKWKLFNGRTPEEAVAKLWLALKQSNG